MNYNEALNAFIREYLVPKLGVKGWEEDMKFITLSSGIGIVKANNVSAPIAQLCISAYPTMCGMRNINSIDVQYDYQRKGFGKLLCALAVLTLSGPSYNCSAFTATHNSPGNGEAVRKLFRFFVTLFGEQNANIIKFKNYNASPQCEHITVRIEELLANQAQNGHKSKAYASSQIPAAMLVNKHFFDVKLS